MRTNRIPLISITKKDFTVQTFCAGGHGGQNQNKVSTAVRIIHRASGAIGESRSARSQWPNKKLALERLAKTPKFKLWLACVAYGEDRIEKQVNVAMEDKNLKIEGRQANKWGLLLNPNYTT